MRLKISGCNYWRCRHTCQAESFFFSLPAICTNSKISITLKAIARIAVMMIKFLKKSSPFCQTIPASIPVSGLGCEFNWSQQHRPETSPPVWRSLMFFLGARSTAATLLSWACVYLDKSRPLGKYCRSSRFVFSLGPRCHGLLGSQK